MDRSLLNDYYRFYQNQLLLGYYKKKGKAVLVPHLIFLVERLLESQNLKKGKIRVLDIGSGKGDLLHLVSEVAKIGGYREKIELWGLDYNEELIKEAMMSNGGDINYVIKDLRHDLLDDMNSQFDIVVSVNTIHEVFSGLLGANKEFPTVKFKKVKDIIRLEVFDKLVSLLKLNGSLMIYDGQDVEKEIAEKEVKFRIKEKVLNSYIPKFVNDYEPWKLKMVGDKKNQYVCNARDFCRFITTFKYLNTKLWPIESKESYQYFSTKEFRKTLKDLGLVIESEVFVNNDLGLWKRYVDLNDDSMYPIKAGLIIASKNYIPSKFDYFLNP